MDLKRKFPGLASLVSSEDVESALSRSSQVMEESRALTSKNSKKKQLIDEQLKNVQDCSESFKLLEKPKRTDSQSKTSEAGLLIQEIQALNLKLSGQTAYIKSLESKVGELKVENEKLSEKNLKMRTQHKQEIEYVTLMYEDRIKKIEERHLEGIEGRMARLEEKIRKQDQNFEAIEEKVHSFESKTLSKGKIFRSEEKIATRRKTRDRPCFESRNEKTDLNKTKKIKKHLSHSRKKTGSKGEGL